MSTAVSNDERASRSSSPRTSGNPGANRRRNRRSKRVKARQVKKVVLEIEPAEEVLDLILDRPGHADEDLLDEALDAVERADGRVSPDSQERAAAGEVVAVEMEVGTARALASLIRRNRVERETALRRIADRIVAKLARADRKRAHGVRRRIDRTS